MTERELNDWIESCAQYLIEQRARDALNHRPSIEDLDKHPDKTKCFYSFEEMTGKLKELKQKAKELSDELIPLLRHFAYGRLVPFNVANNDIRRAFDQATGAWVSIVMAQQQIDVRHPPNTRSLDLQKSAVRLAYACCGLSNSRQARSIARKIMRKAGITEPKSASSISNWIKEFRDDDAGYAERMEKAAAEAKAAWTDHQLAAYEQFFDEIEMFKKSDH